MGHPKAGEVLADTKMKYDTRTGTWEIATSKKITTAITTTITGNKQKLTMPPYTKTITMKPPDSTTFKTKEHLDDAIAKHDEIWAAIGAILEIGRDVTEYLHKKITGHPEESEILADTVVMYDTRTGLAMIAITIGTHEIAISKKPVGKDINPETPTGEDTAPKTIITTIT